MELSYLTRVLRGMRLEKMNHCIDTVHERCGKLRGGGAQGGIARRLEPLSAIAGHGAVFRLAYDSRLKIGLSRNANSRNGI